MPARRVSFGQVATMFDRILTRDVLLPGSSGAEEGSAQDGERPAL